MLLFHFIFNGMKEVYQLGESLRKERRYFSCSCVFPLSSHFVPLFLGGWGGGDTGVGKECYRESEMTRPPIVQCKPISWRVLFSLLVRGLLNVLFFWQFHNVGQIPLVPNWSVPTAIPIEER